MDLFMRSDGKRGKFSHDIDEDKILLLQLKIDKVDKKILEYPKLSDSVTTLANTWTHHQNDINTQITSLKGITTNLSSKLNNFSAEISNLRTKNEKNAEKIQGLMKLKENNDKISETIVGEVKKFVNSTKNQLLIDLFNSKISSGDNLFSDPKFIEVLKSQVNPLIIREISEGSNLKKNKHLLQLLKDQLPSADTLLKNADFVKSNGEKIASIISTNERVRKIDKIEKDLKTLDTYAKAKVDAINKELAKLTPSKKGSKIK